MSSPAKRIVSETVYVKPEKAGRVRSTRSLEARHDATTSTRVETRGRTRSYTKSLGPAQPSAPPAAYAPPVEDSPTPPPPKQKQNMHFDLPHKTRCHSRERKSNFVPVGYVKTTKTYWFNPIPLLVLTVVFWCVIQLLWSFETQSGTLDSVEWAFSGDVHEQHEVTESGWSVPTSAEVLSQELRAFTTRTVHDGYVDRCEPVTKIQQVYSHTEQVCTERIIGYTDELEVYSHTHEVCYDDGSCEEQDVYTLKPSEPIYDTQCENVDRYVPESYTSIECEQVPITHEEPVMKNYYTYRVPKWVHVQTIELHSSDGVLPEDRLGAGQKYHSQSYRYYLYFDNSSIVRRVSRDTYEAYQNSIGAVVDVPWSCIWC